MSAKRQRHGPRDAGRGRRGTVTDGSAAADHGGQAWETAVLIASVAMAAALFSWMFGDPVPVSLAKARSAGQDPLSGVPAALGIGIAAAVVLVGLMSAWTPARACSSRFR